MNRYKSKGKRTSEQLLDEAYLLILCGRPKPSALAEDLRIRAARLNQVLEKLSSSLRKDRLRIGKVGLGSASFLQIERLCGPRGNAVEVGPDTLRVRRMPQRRPGFKPEDSIIYSLH